MKIQFLLAWRYLWGRKQRMVLTTLAVVFAVMLLFGLNSMIPAMMEAFRHNMVTAAGKVDISISSESNNPFNVSTLDQVQEIDGISSYTGVLSKNVILPESMGGSTNKVTGASTITVTGLNPDSAQNVRNYILAEGRFLQGSDGSVVVLPQLLAEKLKLEVGDDLIIPSSQGVENLQVVGILTLSEAAGIDEILVPLSTAQKILNLPNQINTIDILLKPNVNRDEVITDILDQLGTDFKSGPVEVGNELESALKLGESMMWLIGIMALAMASFIIFNTFRTVIAERRRDLGMLRAIGATQRTVMGLILTESLIQGVIGTALGLLAGYLMALGLVSALRGMIETFMRVSISTPIITTGNLIGSIALGIGFTLGSGYFPARAAMKVTPLEAMRPSIGAVEHLKNKRRAVWGGAMAAISILGLLLGELQVAAFSSLIFLIGIILLAPVMVKPVADVFGKLITMILSREGHLAQNNLSRQPGRAAITASSLMIGLAICISLIAMITSIEHSFMKYLDKSLGSDFLLMPPSYVLGGGNLGASQGLIDEITASEGVDAATSLRLATSEVNGAALQIIGINPVTYPGISGLEFSKGDPSTAFSELADGKSIIINGIFATANGINPGDVITLKTPEGNQDYKVVGVAFDYLNAKIATGYISQKNLETDFHSISDLLILVNQIPQSDSKTVFSALQKVAEDYPAFSLINASEFKNLQMDLFKKAMSAIYVLVVMLAVPGLIAMANTMSINIIERTREIGMLRAVGTTQKQVKCMVFAESVLLSALGTTMGILVGLFLSYVLLKAIIYVGFGTDFYFPSLGIVMAIAVGFAFGIIAAMVPARQAAKTVIVEALRFE